MLLSKLLSEACRELSDVHHSLLTVRGKCGASMRCGFVSLVALGTRTLLCVDGVYGTGQRRLATSRNFPSQRHR